MRWNVINGNDNHIIFLMNDTVMIITEKCEKYDGDKLIYEKFLKDYDNDNKNILIV